MLTVPHIRSRLLTRCSDCKTRPIVLARFLTVAARSPGWMVLGLVLSQSIFADSGLTLIAHKGGVQKPGVPANSQETLQGAREVGYQMVEVDVRETDDHHLIAHHDSHFERYYRASCQELGYYVCGPEGVDRSRCRKAAKKAKKRLCDSRYMTLEEVKDLRADDGQCGVQSLDEVLAFLDANHMGVMLDIKRPGLSRKARERLFTQLEEHNFLGRTLMIGDPWTRFDLLNYGVGKMGIPALVLRSLKKLDYVAPVPSRHFFVFEGPFLDKDDLRHAKALNLDVVVSANRHHYEDIVSEGETKNRFREDLERLTSLGLTTFQIDSDFVDLFKDRETVNRKRE